MKTENELLGEFLAAIRNELCEQRGLPYRFTCEVTSLNDDAKQKGNPAG